MDSFRKEKNYSGNFVATPCTDKTKFMKTQNKYQQQCHDTTICNKSFENVSEFKCLQTTLTHRFEVHDEIRRINLGNAFYYLIQKLLFPHIFSKALKIRILKTIILPLVLCVCVKNMTSYFDGRTQITDV
jgi:hypothetical protein